MLTGNYNFFNFVYMALCLSLADDTWILGRGHSQPFYFCSFISILGPAHFTIFLILSHYIRRIFTFNERNNWGKIGWGDLQPFQIRTVFFRIRIQECKKTRIHITVSNCTVVTRIGCEAAAPCDALHLLLASPRSLSKERHQSETLIFKFFSLFIPFFFALS